MKRRSFLALIGVGTTGVWIDGAALPPLSKHIVITITGQCSFCGKSANDVLSIVGVIGRPARICNECVAMCLEIHRQSASTATLPSDPPVDNENARIFDFQLSGISENVSVPNTEAELAAFIDQWQNLIKQATEDRGQRTGGELLCSFCDRTRNEGGNLLAGPETYICHDCLNEASARMKRIH